MHSDTNESSQLDSSPDSSLLTTLSKLGRNARIQKYAHFHAARRYRKLEITVSICISIIGVILGSSLFYTLQADIPVIGIWIGGVLGFVCATLSFVQAHLGLARRWAEHRRFGVAYLDVERDISLQASRFNDNVVSIRKLDEYSKLIIDRYTHINQMAEAYPTSLSDYAYARKKLHGVASK